MKVCNHCGATWDDSEQFCKNCGAALSSQPDILEDATDQQETAAARRKNPYLPVIIIAIIAAAAVAVAAYFLIFRDSASDSSTAGSTTTQSAQTTDDTDDAADEAADVSENEEDSLITPNGSTVYTSGPKATVEGYIRHWADAMNEEDYSIVAPYIQSGSDMAQTQSTFLATYHWYEEFIEAEITDSEQLSSDEYRIITTETFDVTNDEYTDKRITQQMRYTVERSSDGEWEMTTVKKIAGNRVDE